MPKEMTTRGPTELTAGPASHDIRKKVIDIGNSSTPARVAASPRTAWKNSGSTNSMPYIPNVIREAAAIAAERDRLRKTRSGRRGLGDVCSVSRKAQPASPNRAKQVKTGHDCQPHFGPSMNPMHSAASD